MAKLETHIQDINKIVEFVTLDEALRNELVMFLKDGKQASNNKSISILNNQYHLVFVPAFGKSRCIIIFRDMSTQEKLGSNGTFYGKSLALIRFKDEELRFVRYLGRRQIFVKGLAFDNQCTELFAREELENASTIIGHQPFLPILITPIDATTQSAYLLLPYAGAKDLFTLLWFTRANDKDILDLYDYKNKINISLLVALDLHAIHMKNIVHRDIKHANILLYRKTPLQIKISDFGSAIRLDKNGEVTIRSNVFGTPGFIANEMFNGKLQAYYGRDSDVYSLGKTLSFLFTIKPSASCSDDDEKVIKYIIDQSTHENRHCRMSLPIIIALLSALVSQNINRINTVYELSQTIQKIKMGIIGDIFVKLWDVGVRRIYKRVSIFQYMENDHELIQEAKTILTDNITNQDEFLLNTVCAINLILATIPNLIARLEEYMLAEESYGHYEMLNNTVNQLENNVSSLLSIYKKANSPPSFWDIFSTRSKDDVQNSMQELEQVIMKITNMTTRQPVENIVSLSSSSSQANQADPKITITLKLYGLYSDPVDTKPSTTAENYSLQAC